MTNEEAVKIIESVEPDPSVYGWRKVEDAYKMAIKALRNQAKYETALATAMHDTRTAIQQANDNQLPLNIDSKWCNDHCKYGGKDKEVSCEDCGVKYYKHKVGIEVEE